MMKRVVNPTYSYQKSKNLASSHLRGFLFGPAEWNVTQFNINKLDNKKINRISIALLKYHHKVLVALDSHKTEAFKRDSQITDLCMIYKALMSSLIEIDQNN